MGSITFTGRKTAGMEEAQKSTSFLVDLCLGPTETMKNNNSRRRKKTDDFKIIKLNSLQNGGGV
jgi:hypothetical protein